MSKTSDDIILFAGPSLPKPCEVEAQLAIQRRGPAAQGDLLRAAMMRPRAIILIDGYFEAFPSVYHKEILWALDAGIAVYGAASTGALRAAELEPFGMIGIGAIFEAFAKGTLDRDDEVALVHAPAEVGFAYLSEPLVNIRWTLNAAVDDTIILPETAAQLLDFATKVFYPDRSYKALLAQCATIDPAAAERLDVWLPAGKIDQKNVDAQACLARVAADIDTERGKAPTGFSFQHTDAFESLLQEVLSNTPADDPETLDRIRIATPDQFELLQSKAAIAELALALEHLLANAISGADLAREVTEFRQSHGLHDQSTMLQWLADQNLDIDTLSRKLEENARIARALRNVEPNLEGRMRTLLRFANNQLTQR